MATERTPLTTPLPQQKETNNELPNGSASQCHQSSNWKPRILRLQIRPMMEQPTPPNERGVCPRHSHWRNPRSQRPVKSSSPRTSYLSAPATRVIAKKLATMLIRWATLLSATTAVMFLIPIITRLILAPTLTGAKQATATAAFFLVNRVTAMSILVEAPLFMTTQRTKTRPLRPFHRLPVRLGAATDSRLACIILYEFLVIYSLVCLPTHTQTLSLKP